MTKAKRAHFVGIGGVGMSATAVLLKEKGWEITGSDSGCYDPIRSYLIERNIPFVDEYSKDNIPTDVDLVVGGGGAKLADNEEIVAARERGIPVTTFAEVLADISRDNETVLVAGSYGKSTMSSLIAHCLHEGHQNPSWFTGAPTVNNGLASHVGSGELFVIEADEYITSGVDRRSKFLHFKADNVVLIAAEHDHVNIFPTIESYREPFKQLLANVPSNGTIVACVDNPGIEELTAPYKDKTITYGLKTNHTPMWSARDIARGETTTFTITHNGESVCDVNTSLLGDHNIQNIVGAAAFIVGKKILTPVEFARVASSFLGIKRRMEKKTLNSRIPVYDGYGSSVDKARSAIQAVQAHFPNRRIVIVFEPHTFSWRNRAMLWWYDEIFKDIPLTIVYKPAEIGTSNHDQASHEEIIERIAASGAYAIPTTTPAETLSVLFDNLQDNDIVLMLTSGPMDGLVELIPQQIEKRFQL